ncbi:hypothetical protein AVEN_77498-1 [Araneus ventricosus]|uniref:Uncharacterized protein n=1 Tax=Araneus ventricosus TaxID=182803 RepID=A0A4Y2H7N1_ARAVE|nr:hypothetical protein AVEN_77498-1 [Araneus ventricosus]
MGCVCGTWLSIIIEYQNRAVCRGEEQLQVQRYWAESAVERDVVGKTVYLDFQGGHVNLAALARPLYCSYRPLQQWADLRDFPCLSNAILCSRDLQARFRPYNGSERHTHFLLATRSLSTVRQPQGIARPYSSHSSPDEIYRLHHPALGAAHPTAVPYAFLK